MNVTSSNTTSIFYSRDHVILKKMIGEMYISFFNEKMYNFIKFIEDFYRSKDIDFIKYKSRSVSSYKGITCFSKRRSYTIPGADLKIQMVANLKATNESTILIDAVHVSIGKVSKSESWTGLNNLINKYVSNSFEKQILAEQDKSENTDFRRVLFGSMR